MSAEDRKYSNRINGYLERHGRKKRWLKVVTVLSAIVVFCTTYVLIMPAVTMQGDVYCGYEEHLQHTDACYEQVKTLTCELSEEGHAHTDECYEERSVLICGEETVEGHVHSDECYEENSVLICENEEPDHEHDESCYEVQESLTCGIHVHDENCYEAQRVLICEKQEAEPHQHTDECYTVTLNTENPVCGLPIHKHTLQCYSNPKADVESVSVWDNNFANISLSGNWAEDVLEIAKTQIGYKESVKNYQVVEDGSTTKGYTRYGDWYGDEYGDWCAMFCSFCMNYADVDRSAIPYSSNCQKWIETLSRDEYALYRKAEEYIPNPGDLVFFDWDQDEKADHVGFVYEWVEATEHEPAQIRTIEGNKSDCVKYDNYTADDLCILGYGVLPENPDVVELVQKDTAEKQNVVVSIGIADEPVVGGQASVTYGEAQEPVLKKTVLKSVNPFFMMLGAENGDATDPLEVKNYVKAQTESGEPGAVLEYRIVDAETGAGPWINVDDAPETGVPGDADIRLSVNFQNVNVADLQKAGCEMVMDIPDIMRNPQVGNYLTDKTGKTIGTIEVKNGSVLLTFDSQWVADQQQYETLTQEDGTEIQVPLESKINGDFWILSGTNLTEATVSQPPQIIVGDVTIDIKYEEDIIEKNGDVVISKKEPTSLEQVADGWYLTYTLTVTAGEDGCPSASVKDVFGINDYTGEYVVPAGVDYTTQIVSVTEENEDGTTTTKDMQQLTWNIGNMAPNETRTLTYQVKVNDSFIGGAAKGPLINNATVYSKEYEKTHAQSEFKPKAEVTIQKSRLTADYDKLNGTSYHYVVTITASKDNEYTLDPVIFKDSLENTNATVLPFVDYDGGDWTIKKNDESMEIPWNDVTMADDGKSFTLNVGEMDPGDVITLTYMAKIGPGAYPAMGDKNSSVRNDAYAILDEDDTPDAQSNTSYTLERKEWARKTVGDRQGDEVKIYFTEGDVFYDDTTGYNEKTEKTEQYIRGLIDPPGKYYTVPEGSYRYQIVANETGDWDISSASLQDKFSKTWMEYQGYVRVDAYNMTTGTLPTISNSDETVIRNLSNRTPAKTVWVKVDGEDGFQFSPKDIGLEGPYAYLLTYYAAPKTTETILNPVVANEFGITGDVIGPGGKYALNGVKESVSVEVETDTAMNAQKYVWYYAPPYALSAEEINNGYSNGAAYWIIKADGYLGAGTIFKDTSASTSGGNKSYVRTDSLVGLFVGNTGGKDIRDYQNLTELLADSRLEQLGEEYYSDNIPDNVATTSTGYNAEITLDKKVDLDPGESLYIIYKTAGRGRPTSSASVTYKNTLQYSQDGDKYSDPQTETLNDYVPENMEKLAYLGTYDGETFTGQLGKKITDSRFPCVPSEAANSADIDSGGSIPHGTYVNWFFQLDKHLNIAGRYRVYDHIPDGLTPEFVYMYTWTTNFTLTSVRQDVNDLHNELGGNWTEHITIMNGYESSDAKPDTQFTVYWYSDEDNNVVFDLDGFKRSAKSSTRGIQLIIGTRVTDENVLLGKAEGEYNNTAELRDAANHPVDQSSATQTVKIKTLSKNVITENVSPVPFYIAVNPLGEDLASGSDRIIVEDVLSENMTLNADDIMAYRIGTFDAEHFNIKEWMDGNGEIDTQKAVPLVGNERLELELGDEPNSYRISVPDNAPILIIYDTTVHTLPDTTVSIQNTAHWEGVTEPEEVIVQRKEYYYEAGGGASGNTEPSILIVKRDKLHFKDRKLGGAKFALQEMKLNTDGTLSEASSEAQTDETDVNGTLEFKKLKPNTIYCLTETEAPEAYILDSTPRYFMIAKIEDGETDYPAIKDQALNMTEPKITVEYWEVNPRYTVDISNEPIQYELPQTGGIGKAPICALGVLLIAGALMCGSFSRRRRERRFE